MPSKKRPVELASCGSYNQINWKKLTVTDITEFDDLGYTFLHYAARHSQWQSLPIALRDPQYWQDSKDGDTIYMSAYYSADQSWVDKTKLTIEDILKRNKEGNFLALLATHNRTLHTFPKSLITKDILLQKVPDKDELSLIDKTNGEDLLIHQIARHGQISVVPKEELSTEILSIKGTFGESVFHIIAQEQQEEDIPQELWTRETLTLKSPTGVTPLHAIVQWGQLTLPEEITLEDFLNKTDAGATPLHNWAKSSGWIAIPDKYLTKDTLDLKDGSKESLLEIILDNYTNGWASRDREFDKFMRSKISYCLKQAKDSTLKKLSKNPTPSTEPLVKSELVKRKVVKELHKNEVSIDLALN
jgi:hypothetical protein